ncbi:class I lanthipeptide [Aquimarina rubra]|uniref:Class I lanthipeptide n=1 Tax=Aquimarina rubra TaxID=1920033 RepID=A0ABW5LCY9_9FLAO
MKKKKFDGLSLNKNVISKLNGGSIRGGGNVTKVYPCPEESNHNSCQSDGCYVLTEDCALSEVDCDSKRIHCL